MARAGSVAVAITALLVAALGNQAMVEYAAKADGGLGRLLVSLTGLSAWSDNILMSAGLGDASNIVAPVALKMVILAVGVFLAAGLVGRAGPSTAAFLGGWGALVVVSAIAGGAFWALADTTSPEIGDLQQGVADLVVTGLNDGAVFGLYTGWLVGLSLLVTSRVRRPEPQWLAGQGAVPPATSSSYPTIYPPLPGSGEWTGLTAPLPKVTRPTTGQTPAQPQAQPEVQRQAPTDDPRTLWPRSLPRNTPGGGAYGTQRQHRRPNWTRWSSSDDSSE